MYKLTSTVGRQAAVSMAIVSMAAAMGTGPAYAENTNQCVWPSLSTWLPKAERVVVVRVERTWGRPGQTADRFRLDVEEVLRGHAPQHITLRIFGAQLMPGEPECAPSNIDVEVGDRLALGFGPEPDRLTGPVSVAAFLGRGPHASRLTRRAPGFRRTTLTRVRAILGLPATDDDLPATDAAPTGRAVAPTPLTSTAQRVIGTMGRWVPRIFHAGCRIFRPGWRICKPRNIGGLTGPPASPTSRQSVRACTIGRQAAMSTMLASMAPVSRTARSSR